MQIDPKKLILEQYHDFYYKRALHKVAYSGRNSGKSVNIIRALLLLMLSHRDFVVVCLREIMQSIDDSSYREIEKQIREMKLQPYFKVLKKSITCPLTGGVFLFHGLLRNIENVKGISDINVAWFEEAQAISMDGITTMVDTLREDGAEAWFSFNPKNPMDAVSQLFLENALPPDCLLFNTNYDQNPFVNESKLEQINHLKETDYNQYAHRYLGEYLDISENNLFPLAMIREAVERDYDKPTGTIKAGLDIAREGSDNMVLTIVQDMRMKAVHSWKFTPDFEDAADDIVPLLYQYNVDVLTGDTVGMGGGLLDIIKRRIGKTCSINYMVAGEASTRTKYARLKDEAMGELQQWLMDGGSIIDCKELIEDLQVITYEFDNKDQLKVISKSKLKKDGHRSHDWADSLGLALMGKPTPNFDYINNMSRR